MTIKNQIIEALKNAEFSSPACITDDVIQFLENLQISRPKILIVMEGGLIQNVMSNEDVDVCHIDYDVFESGDTEDAEDAVWHWTVDKMETDKYSDAITEGEFELSEDEKSVKEYLQSIGE